MGWIPNFPYEDIPADYFGGGMHLQQTPDSNPDLHELLNILASADGHLKRGAATVAAGDTAKAVVFATAFPTGTVVAVTLTAQGQNVVCYPTAISEAGFTANISGALIADCDVAYLAFPI